MLKGATWNYTHRVLGAVSARRTFRLGWMLALALPVMGCDNLGGGTKDEAQEEDETSEKSDEPANVEDSDKSEKSDKTDESKKTEEDASEDSNTEGEESDSEAEDSEGEDSEGGDSEGTDSDGEDSAGEDSAGSDSEGSDSGGDSDGTKRDCETFSWGKGAPTFGEVVARMSVKGMIDSDGDGEVDQDSQDAGMCALYETGKKCGIILGGQVD